MINIFYVLQMEKIILRQGQASCTIRKHQTLFNISYKTKVTELCTIVKMLTWIYEYII